MAGKYVGFDKLKGQLAKSPGVKDPAALAASIGKRKYGAKRMAKAAAHGDPFGPIGNLSPGTRIKRGRDGKVHEDDPGFNSRTMGNRRGAKRSS
jgi:hypothetical protein